MRTSGDLLIILSPYKSAFWGLFFFFVGFWNANPRFQVDFEKAGTANLTAPAADDSSIELSVMLADKWRSWTETHKASPDQCVWRFGEDAGMRKLTTGPLSKYGYVFRYGDRESWFWFYF